MSYIPFFLNASATGSIVLIGGGSIALAKAQALSSTANTLHIIAKDIQEDLLAWAKAHNAKWTIAEYSEDHIYQAKIVIAATNDRILNERIHKDAKAAGAWVNVVDTPELCDFIFPAIVERGNIKIAISTAGISPTLARLLKRSIEQLLPWNFHMLGEWIAGKRAQVQKKFKNMQARRLFWEKLLDSPLKQEILEGNTVKADSLFAEALESFPMQANGALWLVGAGPGHPDLITLRGAQSIGQADVILYDRLVSTELLSRFARKDALKIAVGKSAGDHHKTQSEIELLIEKYLLEKKIVVRLKGGDPGIYAHAAEEIAVAVRCRTHWQIIPGITAALGCAAHAGIPLTEREGAHSVRFLTLYKEQLHDAAFWHSLALTPKETLVFYMTTHHREKLCQNLIAAGLPAETPVLLIEQGTTPYHAEYEATLATFAEEYKNTVFITPTLIIVGEVVRFRKLNGWRESGLTKREVFFPLPQQELSHAGQ